MRHRFRARLGTLLVKIGPDTRERFGIALQDEGDHLLPDLAARSKVLGAVLALTSILISIVLSLKSLT